MPTLEQMDSEFVDAEGGFDGGDGQVGVVGDGSNAMDSFDERDVGGIDAAMFSLSKITADGEKKPGRWARPLP